MLGACYTPPVANLQVKNVPDALHRKLRRYADQEGRSLRDLVLSVLQKEVDRREFRARLARRSRVDLGRRAAETLDEVRAERDRDLGT